jgi:SHS2 domain-containing protein
MLFHETDQFSELFERHKFISRRIIFNQFDTKRISSTLSGETYNSMRHGHVSEIKAITYHQFELGEKNLPEPHFYARIFLDL